MNELFSDSGETNTKPYFDRSLDKNADVTPGQLELLEKIGQNDWENKIPW